MRTVPTLDQCHVTFSPQNVIYGISSENESRFDLEQANYSGYGSSFKTLDSYDYSSIGKSITKTCFHSIHENIMFFLQFSL